METKFQEGSMTGNCATLTCPEEPEERRNDTDDEFTNSLIKVYIGLICRRQVELARRIIKLIQIES